MRSMVIILVVLAFTLEAAEAAKYHRYHHAKKEHIKIPRVRPVMPEPTFNDIWNSRIRSI